MTIQKKQQDDFSRRTFVASSVAAGLGAATSSSSGKALPVSETDVEIKTPDGICDAIFLYPTKDGHPGVLIWPDSMGLRPTFREMGRRIAAEGYAVLIPNHLYRSAKAPVFDASFDYANNPADREKAHRFVAPFLAPGAAERDAAAFVAFLDAQRQVNKKRKLGVLGCAEKLCGVGQVGATAGDSQSGGQVAGYEGHERRRHEA